LHEAKETQRFISETLFKFYKLDLRTLHEMKQDREAEERLL